MNELTRNVKSSGMAGAVSSPGSLTALRPIRSAREIPQNKSRLIAAGDPPVIFVSHRAILQDSLSTSSRPPRAEKSEDARRPWTHGARTRTRRRRGIEKGMALVIPRLVDAGGRGSRGIKRGYQMREARCVEM